MSARISNKTKRNFETFMAAYNSLGKDIERTVRRCGLGYDELSDLVNKRLLKGKWVNVDANTNNELHILGIA
jgi:hypothetical protein